MLSVTLRAPISDAQRKADPTGTGNIRTRFQLEMRRRMNAIKALIREALVEADVLGIGKQGSAKQALGSAQFLSTFGRPRPIGDQAPGTREFAALRSSDKVAAFMRWLRQEEAAGLLGVSQGTPLSSAAEASWMRIYIDTAYKKGMRDAAGKISNAGGTVSSGWVQTAFNRPIHADRVGLIYTRVYSELEGITAAMDQKISRILAHGVAEGWGPREIARDISEEIAAISRNRAEVLARTEVISAHAEASLNAYEEAGIEGVEVEAEWSTAGDDRVCPECEEMEGKTFDLDEAKGMIPLHPQCRCAWIPKVVNGTGIVLT
jgi:SPP1 gp7 family putative phage head morphogenesis protein